MVLGVGRDRQRCRRKRIGERRARQRDAVGIGQRQRDGTTACRRHADWPAANALAAVIGPPERRHRERCGRRLGAGALRRGDRARGDRVDIYTPGVAETTLTCTVHWPATNPTAAGIVPPESEKLPLPEVAVTMPPTHVVDAFAGFATTHVDGKCVSERRAVAAAGLLLIRMTASVDTWPAETLVPLNVLLTPIAANATVGRSSAIASSALRTAFTPQCRGPR